uniref:resistin-like beta n=1 Tax=Jaculus jaculus TaxID=51337 RepID=UPI000332F859|nr:resistin-like beta [Jaculus jaculus]
MKPTICFLLIFISVLQLMSPGNAQCSLDYVVDTKIKDAISRIGVKKNIACISVKNSGSLASCPAGMVVTGCACGYGCGSWDVQNGNTCHCQCSGMDWTTARCCHLV